MLGKFGFIVGFGFFGLFFLKSTPFKINVSECVECSSVSLHNNETSFELNACGRREYWIKPK